MTDKPLSEGLRSSPASPLETPSEKFRRERRGVALTALEHLLNVAIKPFAGDRPSEQDLSDAYRRVSECLEAFEGEANEAERLRAEVSSAPPPALRELIATWRKRATLQRTVRPWTDLSASSLDECADELEAALASSSSQEKS